MSESTLKESKSQNEENSQNDARNAENPTKPEENIAEGKRKDEIVVNIMPDDEGNKGKSKWNGRKDRYEAFVYVMERAPQEETRKHRSATDVGRGGGGDLRNDFIAKVFMRVFVMLTLTIVMTAGLMYSDLSQVITGLQELVIIIFVMVVIIGIQCCMAASEFARRGPYSYVLLFLTVVCWSIVCAFICLQYNLHVIFYAIIATCICVVICYLLALSSFDFTSWLIYVVMISLALCVVSMVVLFLGLVLGQNLTIVHIVILFISTILNLVMLIIELQMILGGRSAEFTEDDFNLGAFLLYTSIISLFIKLLQLIGLFTDD